MKQKWLDRYREAGEDLSFGSQVLVGFNTNIDILTDFSELDIELDDGEARELREVKSWEDFAAALKYCKEEERNIEVCSNNFNPEIEGERRIGGQAGIMANFLSRLGNRSVLYTPFLSEEISDLIDPEVIYPVSEDNLTLKSISDAVNSDRTKKNHIIEFRDISRRLILSDALRGFGPYFRKGVEEKFPELQDEVDRAIFSGFHDASGNIESKLKKSQKQLRKMHIPKHLEFVSTTQQRDEAILNKVASCFTSIGMDESELKRVADIIGHDIGDEVSLGKVYSISKKIIEKFEVSRVHVHTPNFQAVVTDRRYPVKDKRIRDSMLFGGLAAVSMAEKGHIPSKEDIEVNTDNMHVKNLDDLEHFEDFFELEDFVESGTARLEEYKVIAVPTLIHEEPERMVGLGDLISSGAFISEIY